MTKQSAIDKLKEMCPKTLQRILGHNSLQMTMDLYCHVLDDTLKDEVELVAEIIQICKRKRNFFIGIDR